MSDPERAGGPFIGHEAYLAWSAEWMESWDKYVHDVEAYVDAGEAVVALVHHRGKARGSGIEIDARTAAVYRFKDGKICLYRVYTDRGAAMEAVGLARELVTAIDAILAGYEAWNRRDVDALVRMLEPDAEFVPIEQSMMQAFTGPEGMREFFDASVEVWEKFVFDPVAFVPFGDEVLVELDVRATAGGSGIELEEHWAHVYTQRGGRLMRFHAFRSTGEALAALAYPERP